MQSIVLVTIITAVVFGLEFITLRLAVRFYCEFLLWAHCDLKKLVKTTYVGIGWITFSAILILTPLFISLIIDLLAEFIVEGGWLTLVGYWSWVYWISGFIEFVAIFITLKKYGAQLKKAGYWTG